LKTHERYRSEYRRAVYVVRHPGDAAVSYYRHLTQWALPNVGFDTWFDAWVRGEVDGYGTWQENVESWLDAPISVALIRYDNLKADPDAALEKALRQFGVQRDKEEIRRAVEHNSLGQMMEKLDAAGRSLVPKKLPPTPGDIPNIRGQSGVWSSVMNEDQSQLLVHHCGRAMQRLGYALGPPEGERPSASTEEADAGKQRIVPGTG
jgi:hypothetical protein